MYENIGLALITSLVIAPLSSYITVRLSLSKFKEEKLWERRIDAYERVLDALHVIKKNNAKWDNALRSDRPTPTTEELEELDEKRIEAMNFLERALDLGEFILPKDVITDIRSLFEKLRGLEITEDNFNEIYTMENKLVESALEKIRSKSL